jgi:hypothetical protein
MLPELLAPLVARLPPALGAALAAPPGGVAAAALVCLLLALPRPTRPAAAGLGLLVAVLWVLPPLWPSPRQVVERLPALAAGLAVAPLLLALLRLPGLAVRGVALLAAAWWMAGAPLWWPDVRAAALPLVAMAAAGLWCALRPPAVAATAGIALALALGLFAAGWAEGLLGWLALAAVAVALAAGWRRAAGPPAEAALCGLLVALAAVPVLARGGAADWLAAAAGALALLVGGAGAALLRGVFTPAAARAAGPVVVALPLLAVAAWLSGRLP